MKLKPIHWIISIVVTVAVLYYIFKIEHDSDTETLIWNILGGLIGLVAGLFIYNRFVEPPKKD